jgi:hypothetical protein
MATLEFRDGKREVPDYLADVLRRYENKLYQITHDEAIELANRTMEHDVVESKITSVIATHFRDLRL